MRAPSGLSYFRFGPTACAVGCILAPLLRLQADVESTFSVTIKV
jgi:hypothetical protein